MFYFLIISKILSIGLTNGYIISGTTFRPDLIIQKGKFVETCPDSNPVANSNITSCCMNGNCIDCPDFYGRCKTNDEMMCSAKDKNKWTIASSTPPYATQWSAENILRDVAIPPACEIQADAFLAPNNYTNASIIVDISCLAQIQKLGIRSSGNAYHYGRGARQVTVDGSPDMNEWTNLLYTTLARELDYCNLVMQEFTLNTAFQNYLFRYFKITLIDFYGNGSCMHSFDVTSL